MKLINVVILGISLVLSGCESLSTPLILSDYCIDPKAIIKPSRKDTPGTLRQIAASNEKHRKLCGVKENKL